MNLLKPLSILLLTSIVFLGTAMAADNEPPAGASEGFRIVQSGPGTFSQTAPDSKVDDSVRGLMKPSGRRGELGPLAGVCFTMRTYKVKPTEHFRDNESGWAGYSTCQMGSDFRVRSVHGPTVTPK